MGLAASQARYLSLTARKTNVEYEGQQVNQERTALANQSAALFNEMLALEVPTPPSATDYTRTVYTYVDPATSQNVSIDFEAIYKNPQKADSNIATYTVQGSKKVSTYISNIGSIKANSQDLDGYSIVYEDGKYLISANGGNRMTLTGPSRQQGLTESFIKAEKEVGNEDETTYPKADDYYFSYVNSQTGIQYFIKADGENDSLAKLFEKYKNNTDFKTYSAQVGVESIPLHFDDAILTSAQDGTGRFTSISYYAADQYEYDEETQTSKLKANAQRTTCKLTMSTVQDEDAFDAAMETYEAKKALYDKTVADIDAKTTIIQQQDKTLELHLNQLDTEQQAIQTELDAVKKVIDKNIEETFKIFA